MKLEEHPFIQSVSADRRQTIMEEIQLLNLKDRDVIDHLKNTTTHYMDEMMRTEKLTLVGTMVSSLLHDFKNPFAIIGLGTTIINQ